MILVAQTEDEVVRQVVAGLRFFYAVEIHNHYQYFPVDWIPGDARGRAREDQAIAEHDGYRLRMALEDEEGLVPPPADAAPTPVANHARKVN